MNQVFGSHQEDSSCTCITDQAFLRASMQVYSNNNSNVNQIMILVVK